jgi:uracil-DNA glycosylase family 4
MNLDNNSCVKCPLSELRTCVLNGTGDETSKIVFVMNSPSFEDDQNKKAFSGPSARKLNAMLARLGLHYSQVYFTYATRCRANLRTAEGVRPAHYDEIEACASYLDQEITSIKPHIIVPMGTEAMSAVFKIKKPKVTEHRGIEVWSDRFNCKILPTYDMGAVLRNPSLEEVVTQDLRRAIESSKYPQLTAAEKGKYLVIDSIETFDAFFDRVMEQEEVAIDLETTGFDWQENKIICCSFSWAANTGVLLPITRWIGIEHEKIIIKEKKVTRKGVTTMKQLEVIEKTLEDTYHPWWEDKQEYIMDKFRQIMESNIKFVAQNGKFDWKFLMQLGWNLKPLAYDTLLMHYLLRETSKGEHNLEDMSLQYLGKGQHKKELDEWFKANGMAKNDDKNYARVPTDLLFSYGAADADVTLQLKKIFMERLEAEGMTDLLHHLIMPLNYTLTTMEFEGYKIDQNAMQYAKKTLEAELIQTQKDIDKLLADAGVTEPVDIDSPKQLSNLLFNTLKLKPEKVTKTGFSTDEEVLNILAEKFKDATGQKDKNSIPNKILEFRGIAKLLRTYVIGIEERLDKNSRLHTKFLQEGTESGRLSSRDPNFQNFPRDSKLIKNMFHVEPGNILIEADEGQNEFRWWGIYSNDPQLVKDLNDGLDIHKYMASAANKIPMEQVTKDQRRIAKSIVFGLMFNMGSEKLAHDHGVSIQYAEQVKDLFFSRYPVAKQWKKDIVSFARKNYYVRNRFGRVRHLLAINHSDNKIAYMDEQGAVNSPIQGAASDYVSNAANRIYNNLKAKGLHGKLRNLVHDAIYVEVPAAELEQTITIMNEAMTRKILDIQVPLVAEFKIGKRWGRMHTLKPSVIDNLIQKEVVI